MNLEQSIQQEFSEHFSLLDQLLAEIDRRLLGLDMNEMSELPHSATILVFFKAVKSAKAVRLLIAQGFGQDALHIAQSLFEIMITLEYIAKDPVNRAGMFLAHYNYRLDTYHKRLEKYGNKSLPPASVDQQLNQDWEADSFQEKCRQVGREKEYDLVYRQLAEENHTGTAGLHYFSQQYTNQYGKVVRLFNAGPRETATADAIWLNMYFIRTIVDTFSRMRPPHFLEMESGLDPLTNKKLVVEQVAVRLQRILKLEFPDLPVHVEFDRNDFKLFVKHANMAERQKYAMDGDYKGFFLPQSLLGYAYQIFLAVCKQLNLPVPKQENYNAYVF